MEARRNVFLNRDPCRRQTHISQAAHTLQRLFPSSLTKKNLVLQLCQCLQQRISLSPSPITAPSPALALSLPLSQLGCLRRLLTSRHPLRTHTPGLLYTLFSVHLVSNTNSFPFTFVSNTLDFQGNTRIPRCHQPKRVSGLG